MDASPASMPASRLLQRFAFYGMTDTCSPRTQLR